MKLNLGCGTDVKSGYTNVDFRQLPGVDEVVDLSKFPWPWKDSSSEEIMMLDFLEHFPYRYTRRILLECFRILVPGGKIVVQVPDVEHCARALSLAGPFLCNNCGWQFPAIDMRADFFVCKQCKRNWFDIAESATARIFGGQDYPGNWHQTGFSEIFLRRFLESAGFGEVENVETHHQYVNWNIKLEAKKTGDVW